MDINEDVVPATLTSAVQLLVESLDDDDTRYIMSTTEPPVAVHRTVGKWLRNNWSIWDEQTPLVQWFYQAYGIAHADDISSIILSALWARIKGGEYDVAANARERRDHWLKSSLGGTGC